MAGFFPPSPSPLFSPQAIFQWIEVLGNKVCPSMSRQSLIFCFSRCFFQGDAPALQAVHRRQLPEHRRPQPDQLQHAFRTQDPHDHLSRNGATRLHGFAVDHSELDAQTVREVSLDPPHGALDRFKPTFRSPSSLHRRQRRRFCKHLPLVKILCLSPQPP